MDYLFLTQSANGLIFLLFLLGSIIGLYFTPWFVAAVRKHKQMKAIGVTNVLFGWTFLGWLIALVWAFIEEK